jgi:hypothetical protein
MTVTVSHIQAVQNELKTLHAGDAIRFGLHPLEFSVWQQKHQFDYVE